MTPSVLRPSTTTPPGLTLYTGFGEFHSREGTLIRDHVYRHQHPGEEPPPDENPSNENTLPVQNQRNANSPPEDNLNGETSSDEDDNNDRSQPTERILGPPRRP